ncbi:hypothetical protein GCU67_03425 [Modestobacter muralis]|uniref:Uncharacterized protein n=1 Tax=Modestobacter muralis TaxID=1608614 RepID=A0A6P0ENF6_9ACTN|nr:hypothetical protein [Modestobacter muralis]NEK93231.1 hypothetical protein [Modestobacter muralis]NEN49998.1 hypothetical protein [Modestobacter muralis]
MPRLRWPSAPTPRDELGVVVHGPVVLARSPGITAALRHVLAHPDGLHLPLVVRADGVQAEAAGRELDRHRVTAPARGAVGTDPWTGLLLTVGADGEERTADPGRSHSSARPDSFESETSYWIGRLPADGRLRLTVSWPQAGLAEATTVLQLDDLHELPARVVRLP